MYCISFWNRPNHPTSSHSLPGARTIRFADFTTMVFLNILLNVLFLLRHNCHLALRSLILFLCSCPFRRLFPTVVSSRPSSLYERVPYAALKPYGESSICERWPTSCGTHYFQRSAFSTVGGTVQPMLTPISVLHQLDSVHFDFFITEFMLYCHIRLKIRGHHFVKAGLRLL
jgi:hypothetical protein